MDSLFLSQSLYPRMILIGDQVLNLRKGGIGTEIKTDFQDIVTDADRFAERALSLYLGQIFPNVGIVGEEGASEALGSEKKWYLDPIDGTTNYAAGLPFFGISAGMVEGSQSVLGAIFFPAFSEYFYAVRGEGSWFQNADGATYSLSVFANTHSPRAKGLRDSVVSLGATKGDEYLFGEFRKKCRNVLALGSFTYEACLVAKGQLDAYIHMGATQFDVAAAYLIAEQAGCAVVALPDRPIDMRETKIPIIVARTQALLEEVRSIIV